MKTSLLFVFLIVIWGIVSPVSSHSQTTAASVDRGFGKITPEYRSFYHMPKKEPFNLIDNQGKIAATVLIYTPPGTPQKELVQGTTQYNENVPVKVVVSNLTQSCSVAVNWLAFLFREDGQPSSRGFDAPPGANPDTKVPPMGTYSHIFHFDSIATFKSQVAVLNEVHPEIVLQCPGGPSSPASTRGSGRASSGLDGGIVKFLTGRTENIQGLDVLYSKVEMSGCMLSLTESYPNGYGPGMSIKPIESKLDLSKSTTISLATVRRDGASHDSFVILVEKPETELFEFSNQEDSQVFLRKISQAIKMCGGSTTVSGE